VKVIDTQKEAAALAGVSHDTFHKGETILKSDKVDQEIKDKLRRGEKGVSINKVYNDLKCKKREDSGSTSLPPPPKAQDPKKKGAPRGSYDDWRKLTELAETVKGVTKEMETLRVDAQHRIPARMLCESLAERFRKLSRKLVE